MKRKNFRDARGFTLIELLVVVAVIGIIASVAIPSLINILHRGRQSRTMSDMRSVSEGLAMYHQDNRFFPVHENALLTDIDEALEPYIGGTTRLDGWGDVLHFSCEDGQSYTLISFGKNRAPDLPYSHRTTNSFDSDIVMSNGSFIQWPEGPQQ